MAARLIRILLLPLSWLYSLGWQIYLFSYKLRLKEPYRASCKVVCIGNFSAGGTGKTPTVVFVAGCLKELGIPFVIGCSGYGAPHSVNATVAPIGMLDAAEWGDEPSEIRELLPEVPLIVGRARVTAAQICEREFPGSVLLMDDGFQHMPLAKDVSIILDPVTSNTFTFPAGPYREPRRTGMKRADLVIPTAEFTHQFTGLTFCSVSGDSVPVPQFANIVTAIGRPDNFKTGLKNSGVKTNICLFLPDHDKLEVDLSKFGSDAPWIVTRKDWVKLRKTQNLDNLTFIIAERLASIEPRAEFVKWLKIRLG